MRNPFPKIGKVIKYEFKHSSRLLLPLYGVLLVLGLLTELSYNPNSDHHFVHINLFNISYNDDNTKNDYSFNYSTTITTTTDSNGTKTLKTSTDPENYPVEFDEVKKDILTAVLIIIISILTTIIVVITIVSLARRFKQSMLGEEAYLNLSLPCTMGEQLWGRFIIDFLWILACFAVIFLSFMLCFIRMDLPGIFQEARNALPELRNELQEVNLTLGRVIFFGITYFVLTSCWLITLIFAANAITHLSKNNKGLIKFITVIVLIVLYSKTQEFFNIKEITDAIENSDFNFLLSSHMLKYALITLFWIALQFGGTQYIFTKQLNLE